MARKVQMKEDTTKDIRWIQRFKNFKKALESLNRFLSTNEELNELEEQGLIQAFEYTYELAWNTIRDFYLNQGEENLQGSRDSIQIAFKRGLIANGEGWIGMLQDRNRSSHTYNKETADQIVENIINRYAKLFQDLELKLSEFLSKQPT